MPRPRHDEPTPGELEVLHVLWDRGPSTVRDVLEVLNASRKRAYTSVMTLMNVMTDKGLLKRRPQGRAFLYEARSTKSRTLGRMLKNLMGRAFEGSASSLVAHLFEQCRLSEGEIDDIRQAINEYQKKTGSE